jgi:dethiobiotin synthetase
MIKVVISGTATDIGKTWVATRVIEHLKGANVEVAARKPAQSFNPGDAITDALLLSAASGEPIEEVCAAQRWYEVAMAPPMAATVLGRPTFTIADLVAETAPGPAHGVMLIEGAGGPLSPIASDGDTADLARAHSADLVILVADAGLGTINAVRLSALAFHGFRVIVVLNRFDALEDLHRRNRAWLEGLGFEVCIDPREVALEIQGHLAAHLEA